MKDVFVSVENDLDETLKQNEFLKDRLLEAFLAEDVKNLVITSCVEIRNKDLHDEIKRISKESKEVSNESKTADTVCNDAFEVTQELSKRIVELEKDLPNFEAKNIAFEVALQLKPRENNSLKTLQKENENFMASLQIENAHLKQTYKDLFESVQRSRVETNECDEVKVKLADILRGTEGAFQQGPVRARVLNDLSAEEKERYKADIRATNILLQGIPKDIYSLINHYTDAKDIWDNVKMILEGSELTKDDRESQLYDEFEHFRQIKGETIHGYYVRFMKLINDMRNIKMTMPRMQLNSKFVNNMLPEWSRFITEVKLNRGLKESNFDQLYAYLKQHEVHANENRTMMERFLQPTNDPLALVSNASVQQYPTQSSKSPQSSNEPSPADNFQLAQEVLPTEKIINKFIQLTALLNSFVTKKITNFLKHTINLERSSNSKKQSNVQIGRVVFNDVREDIQCNNQEYQFQETMQEEMVVAVNLGEMQNDVQHNYVVDSNAEYMSGSNIIPYNQYLEDNEENDVQSNVSSVQNDTVMSIINEMHEEGVQQGVQRSPDFNSFFKIKNLEHQIQEKDNVIRDLKVSSSLNVNDGSCETYNAKDVTALIEQNECVRVELKKVIQHYKELYDSIKITRVHTREKTSTMLNEIESLKAQLKSKVSCVISDSVKPKVIAPDMYAIDVKPIPYPLKNNRSAHLNYISHLKESVETVRETVAN
ncbi:hypothetical protein Tco_1437408 [Tanacetum coccineum]